MAHLSQNPSKDVVGQVLRPGLDGVGQPVLEDLGPVHLRGKESPNSSRLGCGKGSASSLGRIGRLAEAIEKVPLLPRLRCLGPLHGAQQPVMSPLILAVFGVR